jgi:nucleolar protein 56
LFEILEGQEIGSQTDEMQATVANYGSFKNVVRLKAFVPFSSAENALEDVNMISEGLLPELLKSFLEQNLGKKDKKGVLGVAEDKLGSAIQDALSITCQRTGVVQELMRGVRAHFTKFISELKDGDLEKAQLGLGHSYSRAKVKFNIHRVDNMIIQSIALLDQLDKDVNTFSMRVREWYSWHFPELVRIVPDNYKFACLVKLIQNKSSMTQESVDAIMDITADQDVAQAVYDAAKTSMGTDISDFDLNSLSQFTDRVIHLTEYRQKLHAYLMKKMHDCAPNLAALIGELVGARLIAHAGSLTNLAKYPASTVQILGAEKALFRALKTKSNTPKYGLIYHSTFIGRASTKNKGRISRFLANKSSLASRIDAFAENPSTVFGEKLREQVEERLKFYETGATPRKNIDVMREALQEVNKNQAKDVKRKREAPPKDKEKEVSKKEKKEKKKAEKKEKKAKKEKKNKVKRPKV